MLVSLENLLKIGQFKEHPVDAGEIAQLLAAAERGVADARGRYEAASWHLVG